MFCNYVSTGNGSALPIIIFPRLVPILLTPIPRLFVRWSTYEGVTSCGGLRSKTGFIATGAQNGIALGFWGIGFSIYLPPVMAYGLFGYALYASVNAEEIEWWPPNNPPIISNENPPNRAWNVPISLTELSFQINDSDSDIMSYSVSTYPDIGSGSGTNKGNGIYTIPVSELQSNTQYQWIVEVADGKDITIEEFSFTTEELPFDPFNEGWQYRKKITVDHTQVDGDLSYFPVLVSTLDPDLRDKAQDDGDDILFMNDDGVAHKLYHEIEHYDDSTGELIAWVSIPSISDEEDTMFYMYYGNPTCNSQQVPVRVWDSNYLAVFHMNDINGNIEDSTSNNNDFIKFGSPNYQALGKIGYGIQGDDSTAYFYNDDMDLNSLSSMSVSAWVAPKNPYDNSYIFNSRWNSLEDIRISFYCHDETKYNGFYATWDDGVIDSVDGAIYNWNANEFHYFTATETNHMNGILVLYSDGAEVIRDDDVNFDYSDLDNIHYIGRRMKEKYRYFHGILDEIRISKIDRNPNWISTEFNNQKDPTGFLSFGPEESCP